MRILNFHTVLDKQDLIVKGNLVNEKRYKGSMAKVPGSGFRGSRVSDLWG
jgi:hypothetical protein